MTLDSIVKYYIMQYIIFPCSSEAFMIVIDYSRGWIGQNFLTQTVRTNWPNQPPRHALCYTLQYYQAQGIII